MTAQSDFRERTLAYYDAMIAVYPEMSDEERADLHKWERTYVDGSCAYGTSDWPGWVPMIGHKPPHTIEFNSFHPRPKPRPTWDLYRLYDSRGNLLYVGISVGVYARVQAHRRKPWGDRIARVSTVEYDSENAAMIAELNAIANEDPIYNVMGRR